MQKRHVHEHLFATDTQHESLHSGPCCFIGYMSTRRGGKHAGIPRAAARGDQNLLLLVRCTCESVRCMSANICSTTRAPRLVGKRRVARDTPMPWRSVSILPFPAHPGRLPCFKRWIFDEDPAVRPHSIHFKSSGSSAGLDETSVSEESELD